MKNSNYRPSSGGKPWYKRWKVWGYTFGVIVLLSFILEVSGYNAKQEAIQAEEAAAKAEEKAAKKAVRDAEVAALIEEAEREIEKEEAEDAKVVPTENPQEAAAKDTEELNLKKTKIEALFKRDPDEKVFEDSSFVTKEGRFTADYIMYVGDATVPYVSAIFYGGDLANITLETELSNDEIEKLLGVTFSEETRKGIKRRAPNVEINFDKRFTDDNIIRFPFELD